MNLIRIEDRDDPRIAAYLDIRERDLTGREDRFIAEGKVVLRVLFAARRFEAQSVLLLKNRVDGMRDTLSLAPPELPAFVAPSEVLDAIAGFHLHRGILAIGRKRPPTSPAMLLQTLPPRALVVVLVGISNHDNMGAIFRNAAAFGADAVLLDATSCDPLYRKAIRVSVGSVLQVPFATGNSASEMIDALLDEGFQPLALSPSGNKDLRAVGRPDRIALFLGTEGDGLPHEVMHRMRTIRIAMSGPMDSLNVAAAAAIALHRLADPP